MNEHELEEKHKRAVEYYKQFYPDKKLNIEGFGLVGYDAISLQDIKGIVNNCIIPCANCKKRVTNIDGWIVILHNPKSDEKPIDVLLFCSKDKNKCATEWINKNISNGQVNVMVT